jgi:S-adenosylmethionine synthetase
MRACLKHHSEKRGKITMLTNALVTGTTGFLGAAIAERLSSEMKIHGCGHTQSFNGTQVDLRDPAAVSALISATAPNVVIHSAAYRDPDFCESNPEEARRLNVGSVQSLCDALPAETYLIFISSDYVFEGQNPPHDEDAPRNPCSIYGRSKCEAEDIVSARPHSLSLRIPVLIGGGGSPEQSGYVGQLVRCVLEKTPVTQDHHHVRYPTWIDDVADAVSFLIEKQPSGVMHYSGAEPSTRYEAALEVAKLLNTSSAHISPSEASIARGAVRPWNSALSTERIRNLGYTRFTPFGSVVQRIADSFTP